jgi:hypothetical protein
MRACNAATSGGGALRPPIGLAGQAAAAIRWTWIRFVHSWQRDKPRSALAGNGLAGQPFCLNQRGTRLIDRSVSGILEAWQQWPENCKRRQESDSEKILMIEDLVFGETVSRGAATLVSAYCSNSTLSSQAETLWTLSPSHPCGKVPKCGVNFPGLRFPRRPNRSGEAAGRLAFDLVNTVAAAGDPPNPDHAWTVSPKESQTFQAVSRFIL